MADQGKIAEVAQLVSAVGGLAWPAIVVTALYLARGRLLELLNSLIDKIKSSTELKFGSVELKGPLLNSHGDVIKGGDESFDVIPAAAIDVEDRKSIYADLQGFMLVHTIKPVRPIQYVNEKVIFDVSIYLHSHSGKGRLNDIKSVSYFLGDHFGKSEHGSKWKVSSANHQFALSVQAYGTFLCVAEIEFQDESKSRTYRYIDTEMMPVYGELKSLEG
ncbi:hypothetical protein BCF46_2939 [Litoreibacter meonggei]|uniref:Prokaryotic YEATS domain-containing protein n=1 Tax=Litoreibacter meonggei TaxID=1049199 RepID=A0A497VC30_9RHOB|nr:pYEATS domain-containing protein [Litoreibacter meonggei]RLJ41151.1 hypothetical protein BCF46_2939 [Litoreibacter meonggei]